MSESHFVSHPPRREAHATETSHCATCPKLCRHTCPVSEAEKRETVTPWALMSAIYLEGKGQPMLQGPEGELVWHCTGCRACQGACKFDNDVPGALHAERGRVYARGDAPERAKTLAARFRERGGNPYRAGLHEEVRARVPEALRRSDARELIWIDCQTAARYPDVIDDLSTILEALGLKEVGFFIDEQACCGQPLYDAGDLDGFAAHARKVRAALAGLRRVYVTSPGCTWLLRDAYAHLNLHWEGEVLPIVDLLTPHLDRLPVPEAPGPATVYHHPCHLARPLERVKEPVAVIEKVTGQPPREPLRTGQETFCSGGGGGLPAILPEVAAGVAKSCVARLQPQPGEVVVTACPTSRRQLEKACNDNPVIDLISLVARRLRGES